MMPGSWWPNAVGWYWKCSGSQRCCAGKPADGRLKTRGLLLRSWTWKVQIEQQELVNMKYNLTIFGSSRDTLKGEIKDLITLLIGL